MKVILQQTNTPTVNRRVYSKASMEALISNYPTKVYKVNLHPLKNNTVGTVTNLQMEGDVLVGEFKPFTKTEAEQQLQFFKEHCYFAMRSLCKPSKNGDITTMEVIQIEGWSICPNHELS